MILAEQKHQFSISLLKLFLLRKAKLISNPWNSQIPLFHQNGNVNDLKNKVQLWKGWVAIDVLGNSEFPRTIQLSPVKYLSIYLHIRRAIQGTHHHPQSPKTHSPCLNLQITFLNLWMVQNLQYHLSFTVLPLVSEVQTSRKSICCFIEGLPKTWTLNCLSLLLAPHSCPFTISGNLGDEGLYRCMLLPYKSVLAMPSTHCYSRVIWISLGNLS